MKLYGSLCRLAIQRGINYIDTSPFYGEGRSEEFIGQALNGVPRDQYFIGTKVGRYFWEVSKRFDFSAERVTKSIEESLKRLQLDYVDILQVDDARKRKLSEIAAGVWLELCYFLQQKQ